MSPRQSASDFFRHIDALEQRGWNSVLSHGAWRLFVTLLRRGNRGEYGQVFVHTTSEIAAWLGQTPQNTRNIIRSLAKDGLVTVKWGAGHTEGKKATPTALVIDLDRLHKGPKVGDDLVTVTVSHAPSEATETGKDSYLITGKDSLPITNNGQGNGQGNGQESFAPSSKDRARSTHSLEEEENAQVRGPACARAREEGDSVRLTNDLHQKLSSPDVGGPRWGFATDEDLRAEVDRLLSSGVSYDEIETLCVVATENATRAPRNWGFYVAVLDTEFRERQRGNGIPGVVRDLPKYPTEEQVWLHLRDNDLVMAYDASNMAKLVKAIGTFKDADYTLERLNDARESHVRRHGSGDDEGHSGSSAAPDQADAGSVG
ncbi:MAG: hypothetical protein HN396_04485 [Gemmatimonadales bacterium]|jgi:hypothetical protein|nr:hypothetical protein [Gemmatimonadales bacterium]